MALTPVKWDLKGTAYIACNCDWGCPCNFNAPPTRGFCEGGWTWQIASGSVDDVRLDGVTFSLFVKWPGAIHQGNGEGVTLVDDRATQEQRAAIDALLSGKFGGPWGILAWTWPKMHGPHAVPFRVTNDGMQSSVHAGDVLEIEFTTIKNPVSGAAAHPHAVMPEGLILKDAALGASKVFKLNKGITLDHSGQYTAMGPFEYKWP